MESKQIYQIRNRKDGVILAQYESKRPALREKKILSSMGLDVQIYSLFVSDRKPKRKRKPRKSLIKPKVEWADDIPLIVPRDAAEYLIRDWRNIVEPFMLGSYRGMNLCSPASRNSDLSVQPKGDGLALCYRMVDDGKVRLVLDDVDSAALVGNRLSIGGVDQSGHSVMIDFRIEELPLVRESLMDRSGWYYVGGPLLNLGLPTLADDESKRFGVVGYVPFTVVYPDTIGKKRYSMSDGYFEITEKYGLDIRLDMMFGRGEREPIPVRDSRSFMAAFRTGDLERLTIMQREMPHLGGFDFTPHSCSKKSRFFTKIKSKNTFKNKKRYRR